MTAPIRDRTSWPIAKRAPSASLLFACLAGTLAASDALAQETGKTADDPARKLQVKSRQLEATEQRAKALQDDVAMLKEERERLNAQLVETAGLIQRSEAQMTAIEARLGELEAQEKILRGSLAQRHHSIAKLLGALQRMGRNPPPVVITRREDALTMVRSAMLLAASFPELRAQALDLAGRLNELVRVMNESRAENERLKSETQRLADSRMKLAGLMENKRQSLAERQAELEQVRKAAAEITRNVSDLSELIAKLDKAVAENTGLGAYEKEKAAEPRKEVAVASPPGSPAVPPPVTAPKSSTAPPAATREVPGESKVAAATPPRLQAPAIELAPRGPSVAAANPGRLKPALAFHLAKAQLPIPAYGRRVLSFGDKTQYGAQSKGIVIETRHGAQITSPSDGWIVYAGEFRTYGQLLIINAGGGYHILLAGLSQIDAQLGQFVLAAEPVGTMVGAPRTAGKVQTGQPVLYVEFRKDGRPIDPDPWWAEGSQKVQG